MSGTRLSADLFVHDRNGCGKTTIIESLRYAITGSFPPGTKSGQAFVHDPRSIGQPTVKAHVKLRFTSRSGAEMVVARSMELTSKKKTITFKQLDGVLRTWDKTRGERVSASHKCSELEKLIPNFLGISKAILDNVLFCHQEDASWPLQEGAVLKKRFDDIFDSSRYTKALEVFRKTEKDLVNQLKDLKADLASLGSHKHAVDGYRLELSEQEDLEDGLRQDKKELAEQIAQAEAEYAAQQEVIEKIRAVESASFHLKEALGQRRAAIDKQKAMVEEPLWQTCSPEELERRLNDFDGQLARQTELEAEIRRKAAGMQKEIDNLQQKQMQLKAKMGKLEAEKEAYEKLVADRASLLERMSLNHQVELRVSQTQQSNVSFLSLTANSQPTFGSQDESITKDDMRSFFRRFENKEKNLNDLLTSHREKSQRVEDELQEALNDLRGKHKVLENGKLVPRGLLCAVEFSSAAIICRSVQDCK